LAVAIAVGGCGETGARPSGKALFALDCGVCHSLTGLQSARRQGGDLLDLHAGREEMLEFVREMAVRHPLSAIQLHAVAGYVLTVERAGRSG
jgi:mono/diheme cytochrome c family protein